MMQISCLVLDDDPAYCELTSKIISTRKQLTLVAACTSQELAREYIQKEKIDLLFVDMEMPEGSGLDFVKSLSEPPLVIFITSHPENALESYEISAIDYLIKPLNEFRFDKAVGKVVERMETEQKLGRAESVLNSKLNGEEYFVIRSDMQYVKVKFGDILYIEAMSDFVKIHTGTRSLVTLSTLKNIESLIPPLKFMRIHRSYIVNLDHVESIGNNTLNIGKTQLPVGDSYKDAVVERVVGQKLLRR